MPQTSTTPAWQVALVILSGAVIAIVTVAVMYWAQAILIPLTMATFLAFLLTPLVRLLERARLGRVLSVLIVVLAVLCFLGSIIWVVGAQARAVVNSAPEYTENIKGKIRSLRGAVSSLQSPRLEQMLREITGELQVADEGGGSATENPPEVVVRPEAPAWLASLPALLGRLAEAVAELAMAFVLLIFMLLKREDLRNRLIGLFGPRRITVMTKAIDEAGQRISRYLLMQLIVNAIFGLIVAVGLLIIGMPYALLWGFLGFMLRYIPYLGPWVAALAPILLSLAVFEGWTQPFMVIGLFLVAELTINNVFEPHLYGRSIGVSEVALLVAAAFWTFLWGPIGLILSSPLTVCLVVVAKYVPQLQFMDVLLGDQPGLPGDVAYYQRLLARDQDEAAGLVLTHVESTSIDQVYDDLLIPALNYAKRDRANDELTDADVRFVLDATEETLEDLGERQAMEESTEQAVEKEELAAEKARVKVLACPARDQADRLALMMLQQLLDRTKWEISLAGVETLASELVERVVTEEFHLVCISALPPGGLAHTRYLCKRLKSGRPEVQIIVGRWGLKGNSEGNEQQLQAAGADLMATTLLESRSQLMALLPLFASKAVNEAVASPVLR